MDFLSVLDSRRSIRSFNGESASKGTIKSILHAANASPVGLAKYETLHLTYIDNKEILNKLESNTAKVFGAERSFLYGAPQLIIVSTSQCDNVGYSNAAIVAHDMALAAVNEGVGACHIWGCIMALSKNEALMKEIGIPEGFEPSCAVAVGMSDEGYAPREIPDERIEINYV